jgi:hypothetical protein
MRHPSDEDLLACSAGPEAKSRGSEGIARARAHLSTGCARCLGKMAQYRQLLEFLAIPPPIEPPEAWVETAALRIREEIAGRSASPPARRARAKSSRIREALEELRAKLVLDSLMAPSPAGIRGTTSFTPRQLLYLSPMGRLHIQVTQTGPRRAEILGQFVPVAEAAAESIPGEAILEAGGARRAKPLSASGEFRFSAVPVAEVRLEVRSSGRVLVVESLRL